METITKISQRIMNVMRRVFGRKEPDSAIEKVSLNFGEYHLSEGRENVLQSCHFSDLQISAFVSNSSDLALRVCTSYPHLFCEEDAVTLALQVPEIVWIDGSASHEVVFHLSAPVPLGQVYDRIISLMFSHLCLKYEWMFRRQTVYILIDQDDEFRSFFIKMETRNHLRLLRILLRVKGINPQAFTEEDLSGFTELGNYEIILFKALSFDWEEIMPDIEEVFRNYFLRGVDFVRMNE